jgi:hypothetical protein
MPCSPKTVLRVFLIVCFDSAASAAARFAFFEVEFFSLIRLAAAADAVLLAVLVEEEEAEFLLFMTSKRFPGRKEGRKDEREQG